jgi:hypothetical protein
VGDSGLGVVVGAADVLADSLVDAELADEVFTLWPMLQNFLWL